MREQNPKAQEKNHKMITHTVTINGHGAFLVQMRHSNKCRSVRNNEIINLHLEFGTSP